MKTNARILLILALVTLCGCPPSAKVPRISPSVPNFELAINTQQTIDLSGNIEYAGDLTRLQWSATQVDSTLLAVEFQGNLMTLTAKSAAATTNFTLVLSDQAGHSASQPVNVLIKPQAVVLNTLTTAVSPNTAGQVAPATNQYPAGTNVTLAATAYTGWHFDHWTGNVAATYVNPTTITLDQNQWVTAVFLPDAPISYALIIGISGLGSVSPPNGSHPAGSQLMLTASADSGWHFDRWHGNVADAYADPTTIVLNQDETVTVDFVQDQPPVACKIHGLNFSPFVEVGQNPEQGSTVSQDQVNRLIDGIAPTIEWIRTYGTGAGNEFAPPRAKQHGLKVAVGAWIGPNEAANQSEIAGAVAIANAGNADIVIIGSEVLLRGDQTPATLISYLNQVKGEVTVPVATADVYGSLLDHPDVMTASDVILVHIYPFWEGVAVEHALKSLNSSYQQVVNAAGGKEVIVAETGWPADGNTINQAVPSSENSAYYFLDFVSWAKAKAVDYFYFEAYDEPWKPAKSLPAKATMAKSIGSSWGILTSDGVLKPEMQAVFDCETLPDNWSGPVGNCTADSPLLELTSVPLIGSSDFLFGQACGVNSDDYAVVVYIYVGGWWNKPYYGQELTPLNADGSWSCSIVTGGYDSSATKIAAFLVTASYSPPILGGQADIPSSIYTDAATYVVKDR